MIGVEERIPCILVTGALGSGKTTLISTLMERPEMAGTALIINEFGEVGLDHLLVTSSVETTLLMENGCMCCSLRGDIVDTVLSLFGAAERREIPPFDRIIIETTGLANPVPIVRDLTKSAVLADKIEFSTAVVCVDGLIGAGLLNDPVSVNQVALADVCLVTKTDLADPLKLDRLEDVLRSINPMVMVHRICNGILPDLSILEGRHEPAKSAAFDEAEKDDGHGHAKAGAHGRHSGVSSWSTTLDRPLPWALFRDWFDFVYSLEAGRMLRMKSILWVEERDQPLLVQAVGPVVTPVRLMDDWPGGQRQSKLVMITRGLLPEAIAESFASHVLQSVGDGSSTRIRQA